MKKNVIGLILILVILISLTFLFRLMPNVIPPELKTPEKVQKIILPKTLYNLAGIIQEIETDSLTFEARIPQLDDKGEPIEKTETRKALITPVTKFTRLTFIETEDPKRRVPQETEIAFKDLKIGYYIEAISNQDISQREEFEVIQIRVLSSSF